LALMAFAPDKPLWFGLAAGLSVGVRLIGVALTASGMIWTFARPGSFRARVGRAALAFAPTVVVQFAWMLYVRAQHGGDAREFGWYGPLWPLVRKLVGVNLWWFWPAEAAGWTTAVAKIALLATFAIVCVIGWRRANESTARLLAAAGLIVVMYD